MGRPLSSNMNMVLAAVEREITWTIAITFPDASQLKYATKPLSIAKGDFTNDLESVSEIRQTLEAPADNVSIGIQNKDRVVGLHLAANWQKWRRAESVVGRHYEGGGVSEWFEMFRGSVQRPDANDLQVFFDVIPDTLTPGEIVCNRNLALPCPFVFKDVRTCAYVGVETACDHNLKSKGGCLGRANTHHYGGMEHHYNPDSSSPGSGGNPPDDPDEPGPPCPRMDQYVRVRGRFDQPRPKMAGFVTEEDDLWNPMLRQFRPVRSATIIEKQPIWELMTANGAIGYSSHPHPIIENFTDRAGRRVSAFAIHDTAVTIFGDTLITSRAIFSGDTGELADVIRIEMEGEHPEEKIYCYGDSPEKLIACHNTKQI